MHADTRILANIEVAGSRLALHRDEGLASVIDAGVGHYTLVFAKDCKTKHYTAIATSDEKGSAKERLDIDRTKSEYPLAVHGKEGLTDAGVNVVIYD